ncbi:MAG TPA: hypothetical protein VGQ57_14315 [Polyangiaceae bacterium]|jgi:hypothetical protein|nr:hypothetical protein [Polyangiaceae bacterium]
MRKIAVIAAGLLVLGRAPVLHAQGSDKALAEELFREGQSLMNEKRYSEACPKLVESQRLDPGTGTLLNIAACHEREGKTATAWAEYGEVVTLARKDGREDRVSYAQERLKAVEPQLSRLRIVLSAGADVPGLTVKLDGNAVGRPALGVAVPVDPGPHVVAVSATGKQPWDSTVDVAPGPAQQELVIPTLADAPAAPAKGAEPASGNPAESSNGSNTQRLVAYGLAGAGVVGVVIGTVFGIKAINKNADSDDHGCQGDRCTPAAAELRNDARTAGNVSTIAFIAGGALIAGGAVLYFTAPKDPERSAAPRLRFSASPFAGSLEVTAPW